MWWHLVAVLGFWWHFFNQTQSDGVSYGGLFGYIPMQPCHFLVHPCFNYRDMGCGGTWWQIWVFWWHFFNQTQSDGVSYGGLLGCIPMQPCHFPVHPCFNYRDTTQPVFGGTFLTKPNRTRFPMVDSSDASLCNPTVFPSIPALITEIRDVVALGGSSGFLVALFLTKPNRTGFPMVDSSGASLCNPAIFPSIPALITEIRDVVALGGSSGFFVAHFLTKPNRTGFPMVDSSDASLCNPAVFPSIPALITEIRDMVTLGGSSGFWWHFFNQTQSNGVSYGGLLGCIPMQPCRFPVHPCFNYRDTTQPRKLTMFPISANQ